MPKKSIATCEVNVTSRWMAALLVLGFFVGLVAVPAMVTYNVFTPDFLPDAGPLIGGALMLVAFLVSLVIWVLVAIRIPRLLRLPDSVRLEEDKVVFRDRGTIHFRDIATFNTDDMLKIRPRGKSTLLLLSAKQQYRPFCRALVRQLKQWSADNPEVELPVQTYFYGSLLAQSIGLGTLALVAGVVIMSFVLGIGTGAAIAIGVISVPVPLMLVAGKRPLGGRVDEVVTLQDCVDY